jgi:hypothetical protein
MRPAAVIIISLAIAGIIIYASSVPFGIAIVIACLLYQVILDFGRSQFSYRHLSVAGGFILDGVRFLLFLLPFLGALLQGFWFSAGSIAITFFINPFTSYPEGRVEKTW